MKEDFRFIKAENLRFCPEIWLQVMLSVTENENVKKSRRSDQINIFSVKGSEPTVQVDGDMKSVNIQF